MWGTILNKYVLKQLTRNRMPNLVATSAKHFETAYSLALSVMVKQHRGSLVWRHLLVGCQPATLCHSLEDNHISGRQITVFAETDGKHKGGVLFSTTRPACLQADIDNFMAPHVIFQIRPGSYICLERLQSGGWICLLFKTQRTASSQIHTYVRAIKTLVLEHCKP